MTSKQKSVGSSASQPTSSSVPLSPTGVLTAPLSNNPTARDSHSSETKEQKIAVKRKPTPDWMKTVYNPLLFSDDDLNSIYDSIRFIGFNRDTVLAELEEKTGDVKIATELIIGCALRGPVAMSKIKLSNGKTSTQIGIPSSGQQGTEHISCQRITAATADLAAFYLKRLKVPKRIMVDCPGWLQFPSAGAIKLPDHLRTQHLEFARKFSPFIGGVFNEQIYGQMMANAYLDDNLKLFE